MEAATSAALLELAARDAQLFDKRLRCVFDRLDEVAPDYYRLHPCGNNRAPFLSVHDVAESTPPLIRAITVIYTLGAPPRLRGSLLSSSLGPHRAELGAGQKPKRPLPREAYAARSARRSRVLA